MVDLERTKLLANIQTHAFSDFTAYNLEDNYSFFHIKLNDERQFMLDFCDYLLDETNLLQYVNNNTQISFTPSVEHYVQLFKRLNLFIDDENITEFTKDDDVRNILKDEGEFISEDDQKIEVRLSKIGRMGEYIFHLILSQFFKYDCIIPKISLTTDKNQSVFGIDALFLSKKNKMILFGESKVSKTLSNGISLLKKSLENYEKEIREEYLLVLSEQNIHLNEFSDLFKGKEKISIHFDDFVKKANIEFIGIPLFVAHGTELNHENILLSMRNRIERKELFGLKTIYYAISLPIINKDSFVKHLTDKINEKLIKIQGAL